MADKKLIKRVAWGTVGFLFVVAAVMGLLIVRQIYSPNVVKIEKPDPYIYIPTGSDFEDVVSILETKKFLKNEKSFRWTAHQMKYDAGVKPGRYLIKPGMSNKELISMLRAGKQIPVQVIFNTIRTKEQLATRIGEQIEAKPEAILRLLNDHDYVANLGFTSENVLAMFIPDTYEFYWNTSADRFLQRMKKEYDKFWTPARIKQAKNAGFTPVQVSVIASIVQLESNKEDEKPLIAGVYINRFKKDWKLEADPTLVYALGNFTITRVLNVYKDIDSPYNTYKYKGLPPGPICLPSVSSIRSVLNYRNHNYMYFCARADFSGYHSFASTYSQHLNNARRFQKALDRRGIRS
jgi:UPF0755 protein